MPGADESDKDAEGRALNTAWRPTFINGSSNPGGAAGTRLDPANATPLDAYRWTLGALAGIVGPIEDLERYRGCLPILMWRSRNKYSYGITAALESQIRIDAFSAFKTVSGSALGAPVQAFPVPASTFFKLRQQHVW